MPDQLMDRDADQRNAPVRDGPPSDDTPYMNRPMDGSLQDSDPENQSAAGKPAPEGVQDPWSGNGPADRGSIANAERSGATDDGSSSPGNDKEGDDNDEGADDDDKERRGSQRRRLGRLRGKVTRKRATYGAAALGGVAGVSIVMLLATTTFKIENMVQNLQSRMFSSSEAATKKMERRMFTKYVQKHVLPNYKNCRTTISKSCSVKIVGNGKNPVTNMYRAWGEGRLEEKLAAKYGLAFEYHKPKGGGAETWFVTDPDNPDGIWIGDDGSRFGAIMDETDKQGVRDRVDKGLDGETKWKKMLYHYKVGRLLEQKYGIRRCMAYCGKVDQFKDFPKKKFQAAQILIMQRAITPRAGSLGIVMECLISGNCSTEKTPAPVEPGNSELEGTPQTGPEREVQKTLTELAASYGIADKAVVEKMIKNYDTVSERGYTKFVIEELLKKIGLKEVSKTAADSAPVIGWINRVATIIHALDNAGRFLKMATYITNAPAAVAVYMSYRTYADEIHTGKVDPQEVGSFVNSLGPGNHGNPDDPPVGGTASAEEAPLYQAIMTGEGGSTKSSTSALVETLLPAKAFAATSSSGGSHDYLCENGKPPTELVCPEEKLGSNGNDFADGIHNTLHTPPLSVVTSLANEWHGIVGGIINTIGSAFGAVLGPFGLDKLSEWISGVMTPFFEFLASKIVPNPFGNMSGGRSFDMAAAGANVAGRDACSQIGCKEVSTAVAASIIDEQKAAEMREFDRQPLYARLFDTSNSHSLVTKTAMAIPFGYQASVSNNVADIMSNPFGTLFSSFGHIFSDNNALAATDENTVDPFKIGNNAYTDADLPEDPEALWDSRGCDDTSSEGPVAKWQASATDSELTGMPEYSTTEPCLLIKSTTGTGGGYFDQNLLTEDDRSYAGDTGGGDTGSGGGVGTGTIDGNAQEIAQQILKQAQAGKITFAVLNTSDTSDGSTPEANIKEMAQGKPANTTSNCSGRGAQAPNSTVPLNTDLLKFILENSQKQNIIITALAGQCHTSPSSMHYQGKAVDFGCPFDGSIGDSIGKKYGVADTTGEYCSNAAHYHYSVGGG